MRADIVSYDFIAFQECNNKCSFCFQRNTVNSGFIDKPHVLGRFNTLIQHIHENHLPFKQVNIDMTGGELFFMPDLEDMYFKIVDRLFKLQSEIGKPVRLLLGTNLLYKDMTLVNSVIDYIARKDISLLRGMFTSFDMIGRFSSVEKMRRHQKNTIDLYRKLSSLNVPMAVVSVLHKRAMSDFMDPKTDFQREFKRIYDDYYNVAKEQARPENGIWPLRLSWTTLSPNTRSEEDLKDSVPSAEDNIRFFKYLFDNYSTLAVVQSFVQPGKQIRCGGSCWVCKTDCVEKSCDTNIYGREILDDDSALHVKSNDPSEVIKFLVKKFGCASCRYFERCYIRPCPAVLNFKAVESGDLCWRKKIYEYVESKKRGA